MESNYKVDLSLKARMELRQVQEYITEEFDDIGAARRQSKRILKAIKTLEVFPKLYRVRRKNSKGQELRYMPIDNFMIIYSVDDNMHIVHVLHIMYGKRNIESII